MPFYEYECPNCGYRDEVLQKITDKPLKKCPSCGKNSLRKLMDTYEVISKKPESLDALPQDYVDGLMKGVVGFEMNIEKVEARFKLSQNKDDEDYQNVMRELNALNDYNAKWIAEEMERRKR